MALTKVMTKLLLSFKLPRFMVLGSDAVFSWSNNAL